MNSIPLIKGNTPQEINTSIIALKKALSELEAQDRLLQATDKDVQDKIKQINELIEGINTHLGTVDSHLTTIDGQITALQPVDTVTSGNMHSVTSNAVANELIKYMKPLIGAGGVSTLGELENTIVQGQSATACFGSQQITDGPNGNAWYNFFYIPHKNGIGSDNYQYGILFLTDMTSDLSNMWLCHLLDGTWYPPKQIAGITPKFSLPISTTFVNINSMNWELYKYIGGDFYNYYNATPNIAGKTKKVRFLFSVYTDANNAIYIGLQRSNETVPTFVYSTIVYGGINPTGYSSLAIVNVDPSYLDHHTSIWFHSSDNRYVGIGYAFAEIYYE